MDATESRVAAEAVVHAPLDQPNSFSPKKLREAIAKFKAEWKGKLHGKVVLITKFKPAGESAGTKPQLRRYTDQELTEIADAPTSSIKVPIDPANLEPPDDLDKAGQCFNGVPFWLPMKMFDNYMEALIERNVFLKDEGVAAVLTTDRRSHTGLVHAEESGAFRAKDTIAPPTFVVTQENYGRIVRLLVGKTAVRVCSTTTSTPRATTSLIFGTTLSPTKPALVS